MKESLRRPILFAVIIITGSLLILFDIPLIILLPIVLIVGVIILIVIGAVTVAEIKTALNNLKPANLKKIGIIKKLDSMKFFEKSKPLKDKKQAVKAEAKQPVKGAGKKSGIGLHLTSFVSSIKSLGTLLKARSKSVKKVDEINKQLDKAVSEKVEKSSALANAGITGGTSVHLPSGGAGNTAIGTTKDQDPFLSLSEDEFDAGLLDSLDDIDSPMKIPEITPGPPTSLTLDTSSLDMNEPDIPLPSLDIDGEAGNILADSAEGLEEFDGLDGGDAIDSDFGDLDNLNLDDVDLDDDSEEKPGQSSATPPAPAPVTDVAPIKKPEKEEVKTDWIKSDAPKNANQFEDQIATQSDMAAFSGGAGASDADLLSSLASEVKQVKKEKNLALLRDLKDFKAPATDIESELNDIHARMTAATETQNKRDPKKQGIK